MQSYLLEHPAGAFLFEACLVPQRGLTEREKKGSQARAGQAFCGALSDRL